MKQKFEPYIEKIGFRLYCVWYDEHNGIHFKGSFNALQALRLLKLKGGKEHDRKSN